MKIPKSLKLAGGVVGALIVVGLFGVGYFVYTRYWVYQGKVDAIVRSLSPEEASPPVLVKEVIRGVASSGVAIWVPSNLVREVQTERRRMLEWHAQEFVWYVLLPYRLSEDQRIALYCRYMVFERGRGLAHGARYYYSKDPERLNAAEVLGLLAISRSPSRYSPRTHPENFRKEFERLKTIYGAV